jgi:hypothetical protein
LFRRIWISIHRARSPAAHDHGSRLSRRSGAAGACSGRDRHHERPLSAYLLDAPADKLLEVLHADSAVR